MVPFGILGTTSDWFYLKGIKERNIFYLSLAKTIFPFEKEILVGPSNLFISTQTVNLEAKNEIKDALKYDPYSVSTLSMYLQYANLFGDKAEVKIAYDKLKLISPNSKMTKIVFEKLKEQRKD